MLSFILTVGGLRQDGGGWACSRCLVWKLEISRKSKCVGAKERALTTLGIRYVGLRFNAKT